MTTMKRWYRSRKNQFVIVMVFGMSLFYYVLVYEGGAKSQNLDLTRRSSIIDYIENKLQEALKEDKGTGCDIPELDPFSKEVMAFDKDLPKVTCPGHDWVRCWLSECRVSAHILATYSDIQCTYRDILYESDAKYTIGSPTIVAGSAPYVLVKSDHASVNCAGYDKNSKFKLIQSTWEGHVLGFRTTAGPQPPREDKALNVLILAFDSTSRNGFIRRMPKSYKVVTEELDATILHRYNIVGDGTPATLFPMLTGLTELELPESRKSMHGSGYCDDMPFIFYKLKDEGYRTSYFEDSPAIGTFQYRFNGFRHQPADHYLRAFYREEAKTKKKSYCVGAIPQYQLMLNITDQFFNLDGKKFGFTFIADITHDNFNMISTADEGLAAFLRSFKDQGRFEDTMLVLMGDHGPRYANVRGTFQGKLEERLPLMAIVLPKALTDSRPHVAAALKANVNTLTTPHDLHATLLDVLNMRQYWNRHVVPGADLKRGLTMLEEIPKSRSCSEAGIEPHWCACLRWDNVSSSDPMYVKVAHALLDHLNNITEPYRAKCGVRTLTSIQWVSRRAARHEVLAFQGAKDNDGYTGRFGKDIKLNREMYSVKMTVGPGTGVYEASVTLVKPNNSFIIDTRDVQRTNAYGTEPACISATYPHLNMFCYCNG